MSVVSRVAFSKEVEFRGRFLPLWHVSHWDKPSLMAVIAPRGTGASEFIAQTEAFLDHNATARDALPKLVIHNAKEAPPKVGGSFAQEALDITIRSADAANVILRYTAFPKEEPQESYIRRARFVVVHTSLLADGIRTQTPFDQILPGSDEKSLNPKLVVLPAQILAVRWVISPESGQWVKQTKEHKAEHKVAFVVFDRQTNTVYADVQ